MRRIFIDSSTVVCSTKNLDDQGNNMCDSKLGGVPSCAAHCMWPP
jgi:hypothetical protein